MDIDEMTAAVRSFNRFYTKQIGVLHEGMLQSKFSLAQARVLFELAQRNELTASVLQGDLGLDAGYLSRILRDFESDELIRKERSKSDGRKNILSLTQKGREAFALLDSRSQAQVRGMLEQISKEDADRLISAIQTITDVLGEAPTTLSYILRPHEPGDIGWLTYRHAMLYSQEHGWDESFEALTAEILSEFLRNYDPKRERSWIAEANGEIVGCVFITKGSDTVAKLRLLLVEPKARGLGLGTRLVDECVRFSRRVGYRKITLYTNNVLLAARHIYEKAGFRRVKEWPHHSYGHDLIGEDWELDLRS
ncbi:MAG: MarR family transcriptional regulator [Phycisphaerales bacterium]|nr:MAG: MarR family transcriptional regulator [Phycisphaerales bacterium]